LVPGRQQRSRRCAASPSGRVVQALAEERYCPCRTVWPARSPGQTVSSWRAPTRVGSAVVMAVARTDAGRSRGALSRSPTGSSWTSPMMSPLSDDTLRHRKTWFPISEAVAEIRAAGGAQGPAANRQSMTRTSWSPQVLSTDSQWSGPRRTAGRAGKTNATASHYSTRGSTAVPFRMLRHRHHGDLKGKFGHLDGAFMGLVVRHP
jgi:hypothetical protein